MYSLIFFTSHRTIMYVCFSEQSILTSKLLDLDTVERVVQWSVAGEGLNFFLTMDKKPLKDALCRLILSFDNFENEYER